MNIREELKSILNHYRYGHISSDEAISLILEKVLASERYELEDLAALLVELKREKKIDRDDSKEMGAQMERDLF